MEIFPLTILQAWMIIEAINPNSAIGRRCTQINADKICVRGLRAEAGGKNSDLKPPTSNISVQICVHLWLNAFSGLSHRWDIRTMFVYSPLFAAPLPEGEGSGSCANPAGRATPLTLER
jgi:hypothetical protein